MYMYVYVHIYIYVGIYCTCYIAGTIMHFVASTQRFVVLLHGEAKPVSIKCANLELYKYVADEFCHVCGDGFLQP